MGIFSSVNKNQKKKEISKRNKLLIRIIVSVLLGYSLINNFSKNEKSISENSINATKLPDQENTLSSDNKIAKEANVQEDNNELIVNTPETLDNKENLFDPETPLQNENNNLTNDNHERNEVIQADNTAEINSNNQTNKPGDIDSNTQPTELIDQNTNKN